MDVGPGMTDDPHVRHLRRTVLTVAALNAAYFFVELAVALAIGSVALLADSVDFLEDTAVNLLIFLALGWSLRARARTGKLMALVILLPAAAAAWQAVSKIGDPTAPDPRALVITASGAVLVNSAAAWLLAGIRRHGGSLGHAAWLAARNDVLFNVGILVMAGVTAVVGNGWPDIVLGAVIIVVNTHAAVEVWEVAEEERLAARALDGETID